MSESADYTATSWVPSHDYKDARAAYTSSVVDRSYSAATAARVSARDLVLPDLNIDTPSLIVVTDVTGSMGKWPAVMFGKLPYLRHELKQYLGEDAKLIMAAVGDAYSDNYPLQIKKPADTFEEAKEALEGLVIEGNGGGQTKESYELAAAYFATVPNVARSVRPILVFIGDEHPYDTINADQLRALGVTDAETRSTADAFTTLNSMYEVFLIHKPYGSSTSMDSITASVRDTWRPLLPPEHIIPLDAPERVVDVMFGILAAASGKVDSFKKELTDRQTPEQVRTVMTALHDLYGSIKKTNYTLPKMPTTVTKQLGSGKSTMHTASHGRATKPLL
jgi:hypothetical protein